VSPLKRACVTLALAMCQPLVCACLAKVVGDVTETLGVQDFGTPKDLGCSIVEGLKGLKAKAHVEIFTWEFRTWEVSCAMTKRGASAKAPNMNYP
jgi:hypothetical protein